ncbi:MAG TPA: BamA/TamA family outer membrane protein [Polyangia bacterium]|nr:BamA/TamA family outer membrane protein [Polyangia bacterium]
MSQRSRPAPGVRPDPHLGGNLEGSLWTVEHDLDAGQRQLRELADVEGPHFDRRFAPAMRSRGERARRLVCTSLRAQGVGMDAGRRPLAPLAPLLSLIAVAGCASGQPPGLVVQKIRLEGNHALSDRTIKAAIATQETGWWPFAAKHTFDPVVWETDLRRIVRLYQSRGYSGAEIVSSHVAPSSGDRVVLEVTLREGPPTRISSMGIAGLDALPASERATVLKKLPTAAGGVFTEPGWEDTKGTLRQRLRARGYATAKVEGLAVVDRATHEAELKIAAQPGLRYRFGDVDVDVDDHGTAIHPGWIRDEVRQAIPDGARFSDEDLEEARRRVVAMGVFGAVSVTAGQPDAATRRVPVLVETQEAPFHTLRLGGGVRLDQVRTEGRLVGEWTNRNFLGGMRRLTAHGEAGWAFIPGLLSFEGTSSGIQSRNGPVGRAQLTFEQPRFLGRPTLKEQSSLELDRMLQQTYDEAGGRLANGVSWRPRSSLTILAAYHLEGSYLNGAAPGTAFTAPLTLGCETSANSCFVWLSYLEEAVTWDRRDDLLEPRRGFYASLSLQQGGGPLGGDFEYLRVLPELRGYLTIGGREGPTFAARLRLGELLPSSGNPDDSAVDTRFYAGGAFSMRGFSERRLSPLLLTTPPPTPGTPNPASFTLPIGGDGLVDGSFEVRWPVTAHLALAAFVDLGTVTRGPLEPSDLSQMLFAVGVGVRYLTPIGPIRLDLARRLPFGKPPVLLVVDGAGRIQEQSYAVSDSCFGLGGSGTATPVPDGLCAVHLSIGEAF